MAVTDEQVAILRAYLIGDDSEHERLTERHAAAYHQTGYGIFVAAAFVEAVTRQFGKGRPLADVIRFVGKTRVKYLDDPYLLEPLGAERLIRAALGDHQAVAILDDDTKARGQVILLPALIDEQDLDDVAVDALLARARERADFLGA